jgi:polyisoprenoid-binding protein YceI
MSVLAISSEPWAGPLPAGAWRVDASRSTVEFHIKHMMVATVKGRFTAFDGTLEAVEDGALEAHGTIQVASLDTHDAKRDKHLRASDFFDATRHPEITFVSTDITQLDTGGLAVTGQLTIKGITRSVVLTGTVQDIELDPCGNERVALELHGALDRRDFGLTWNKALETGAALVADQVQIELAISAVKLNRDAALIGAHAGPQASRGASAPPTRRWASAWFG